jgi:hypothetical protein
MLPVGGLGMPPAIKVPQDWGIRGLLETISAFYLSRMTLNTKHLSYGERYDVYKIKDLIARRWPGYREN